jgi:hypothetical protein
MTIRYKTIKTHNPISKGNNRYIYVRNETILPNNFINRFSKHSHINPGDIVRFTHALRAYLLEELNNGNIVQTGTIGSFSPKVRTKDELPEMDIQYRPDKELLREIKGMKVKEVK